MTVEEAIERKANIAFEKQLLGRLVEQHDVALKILIKENAMVQERLDKFIQISLGSSAKSQDDEYQSIAKPFLSKNEARLVDPLRIRDLAEKLLTEIGKFESEVDFVISSSNAITIIDIMD
jgi:hypothetical protein